MESVNEVLSEGKRKLGKKSLNFKRKKLPKKMSKAENDRLEKLVLGDASFMLRTLGVGDSDSGVEDDNTSENTGRQPAWEDDDDQGIRVTDGDTKRKDSHRRGKFTETFGRQSWAKLDREVSHDSDEEEMPVVRTAGKLLNKPTFIPKGSLKLKQLASLNNETRSEGPVIKCVEFHPTSTVALVAGLSGIASIFQVDGKRNNKLASVQFEKFPIRCGHFTQDGSAFIVGSNLHSFFYVYDMMEGASLKVPIHHNMGQTNMKSFEVSPDGRLIAVIGRYGHVNLLAAVSKEWICNLSHNDNVTSIAFSPDGALLYCHTDSGEVYIWDMDSRTVMRRFQDEGTLVGTAMAVSDDYLATGSSWGVVNLYERSQLPRSGTPATPLKIFNHLVTQVTSLRFNSTQQILAMASDEKDHQVKLAHVPSMTVFCNFPTTSMNLGRVQALDFSPASGYFATANSKKTASLFRLGHYQAY